MKDLHHQIISFRDERNWKQFHTLKDLLLGLNIECGELNELFLWKSEEEIAKVPKEKVEHELADIFIFVNYISHHFDIDLEKAVTEKLKINAKKYPVDKSFGSNKKYDQL
ncbi:MAG TPA: nucleotide pyrophosphohydrolase [Bacteroidia bacterium]|jgi:NTP pyrophosphatase (non-canonical NTP hydrolase)|nr:nucleotide pyrophosphohydrolase [Bacteroidia bacterium]